MARIAPNRSLGGVFREVFELFGDVMDPEDRASGFDPLFGEASYGV